MSIGRKLLAVLLALAMAFVLAGCDGSGEVGGGGTGGDIEDVAPASKVRTVTFNANGGAVDTGSIETDLDGRLPGLPVPTRGGHLFNGWFTDATGGDQVLDGRAVTENLTLYAHWVPIIVRFSAIHGDLPSGPSAQVGPDGRLDSLPVPPAFPGLEFEGWFTAQRGGEQVTTATVFDRFTTIYAHWNGIEVSFDAGGGSSVPAQGTVSGRLSRLPTPSRSGYDFAGWYTEPSGGTRVDEDHVFDGSATVYARWTEAAPVEAPWSYDASTGTLRIKGGGSVEPVADMAASDAAFPGKSDIRSVIIEDGISNICDGAFEGCTNLRSVSLPDSMMYIGKRAFYGCTGLKGLDIPDSVTSIGRNAFRGCDGLDSISIPKDCATGDVLRDLYSPVRTGSVFLGWYTAAAGGDKVTNETVFTANQRIYSRWTQAVATFNANGGTVSPATLAPGADGRLPYLPVPTRPGCVFKGWFHSPSGGIEMTADTLVTGIWTLYAHWEMPVTFDANGGTASYTSVSLGEDGRFVELPTAVRPGFDFLGWYTEAGGGERVTKDTVLDRGRTLYAHWIEITA